MKKLFLIFLLTLFFIQTNAQVWNESQKIVTNDRAPGDFFGWSMSIDDNVAIIGAKLEDEDATGGNTLNNSGAAYFLKLDNS